MNCPKCNKHLDRNHPQGPQVMMVNGKMTQVCVDCYFKALGDVVEGVQDDQAEEKEKWQDF